MGVPLNHPFSQDFSLETIHLLVPPFMESPVIVHIHLHIHFPICFPFESPRFLVPYIHSHIQMDGLQRKIPLNWMIWGLPLFQETSIHHTPFDTPSTCTSISVGCPLPQTLLRPVSSAVCHSSRREKPPFWTTCICVCIYI